MAEPAGPDGVDLADDPAQHRFVARVGEDLAGFVSYRRVRDRLVVIHTTVHEAYEGRGLGAALARAVLDQARADGLAVEPRCPFVASWIQRHPDYQDLVTGHTQA